MANAVMLAIALEGFGPRGEAYEVDIFMACVVPAARLFGYPDSLPWLPKGTDSVQAGLPIAKHIEKIVKHRLLSSGHPIVEGRRRE